MTCNKISIIGAGNTGSTLAHLIFMKNLADHLVLFDINENVAKGKALDIAESSYLNKSNTKSLGSCNYKDIEGSDIVVVTAGSPRKPGMSRDDLIAVNTKVMIEVGHNIAQYAPNAFVICLTNPLDVMVWVLQNSCKVPHNKVVGMAGVLDSARFAYFLADELNINIADIQTFVLGGHGDAMVPLVQYTSISGIPLQQFIDNNTISQAKVDEIVQRARTGGAEIVNLLGNGSAYFAPAHSMLEMIEAYLYNQRKILPLATMVNGKYGVDGLYVGVPAIVGKNGVEDVVEIQLDDKAKDNFQLSVDAVQSLMEIAKQHM